MLIVKDVLGSDGQTKMSTRCQQRQENEGAAGVGAN